MPTINVNYADKEFEINFDYQPEEKMVRYDSNNLGYPGCPAEMKINSIYHNGENWTDFFNEWMDMQALEEDVWDHIESGIGR